MAAAGVDTNSGSGTSASRGGHDATDSGILSMSSIFPTKSPAVCLPAGSTWKDFSNVYCIPLPFGGKRGIWPEGGMTWDGFYQMKPESAPYFVNFQLMLWLLEQNKQGTPDLTPQSLLDSNSKLSDILKQPQSYAKGVVSGSLNVNPHVAQLYGARYQNKPASTVEPPPAPSASRHQEDPMDIPEALAGSQFASLLQGISSDVPAEELSRSSIGLTDGSTRPKFDIVVMPIHVNGVETDPLLGVVLVVFCHDPNWSMIKAYQHIINEIAKRETGKRSELVCSIDPDVAKHLTSLSGESVFTTHFTQMALVDEDLAMSLRQTGSIVMAADSAHSFERLWSFDLAMKHMDAHARDITMTTHAAIPSFYRNVRREAGARYTFDHSMEVYGIPYSSFHWNRKTFDAAGTEIGRSGIYYTWFPWAEKKHKDFVRHFSSNSIDGKVSDMHEMYHRISMDVRKRSGQSQIVMRERGMLNAIQALRTRAAPHLTKLRMELNVIAMKFMPFIFLSPKTRMEKNTMRFFNILQKEFNSATEKLDAFERLVIRFLEMRVLSPDVDKPLTDAVKALLSFIHGKQNDADTSSSMRIPNVSVYHDKKLTMPIYRIIPQLDSSSHWLINLTLSKRFIHNLADTTDVALITLAANDSMRAEVGLHVNVTATGPKATSKSEVFKQILAGLVSGTYLFITTKTPQSEAVDLDRSDMTTYYDEGPLWYTGDAGGASGGSGQFTPEASEAKAKLSQGWNSREICEIIKQPNGQSLRITRLVMTWLLASVLIASNLRTKDDALDSRFINIVKQQIYDSGSAGGIPLICAAKEYQVDDAEDGPEFRLGIEDLITAPRQYAQQISANQDLYYQQRFHAMVCLVQKEIESGGLPAPSCDMNVVTLYLYKWQKSLNGSKVRALLNLMNLQTQMAIANGVTLLLSIPGVAETFDTQGFTVEMLHKIKPYIWVTFQQSVTCFGMILNEFMEPQKMVVVQYLLNHAMPTRWDDLRRLTQIRHKSKNASRKVVSLVNAPAESTAMDLETDSYDDLSSYLVEAFKTAKDFPVEELFLVYGVKEISWRKEVRGKSSSTSVEEVAVAGDGAIKDANKEGADMTYFNLNYLELRIGSKKELLQALVTTIKPQLSSNTIEVFLNNLQNQSMAVNAVDSVPYAALAHLKPNTRLPRRKQDLPLLVFNEMDRKCYVCIHLFDQVMNSTLDNMLVSGIQSMIYKGMKPRGALLVGNDPRNMVPHFRTMAITQEEIDASNEDALRVLDPSFVSERTDSLNSKFMTHMHEELTQRSKAALDKMVASGATGNLRMVAELDMDEQLKTLSNMEVIVESELTDRMGTVTLDEHGKPKDTTTTGKKKKKPPKGRFIEITEDIDEWACKKHFLRVGVPLTMGPTGDIMWLKEGKAVPLPTPLNLSEQHLPPPLPKSNHQHPPTTSDDSLPGHLAQRPRLF